MHITIIRYIIYLTTLATCIATLVSCNSYEAPDPNQQQTLVVEGWIEDGGYPTVYLTRSLNFGTEYQEFELEELIEDWARVSITDLTNGQEVVLTGVLDSRKIPPYYYVSYDMKGQAGHTYRLDVSCTDGSEATAVTTIPHSTKLDSIAVNPVHNIDSLRLITAYIHPTETPCHYLFYVRDMLQKNSSWMPAYASLADSQILPPNGATTVNNTHHNTDKENSSTYFKQGQVVGLKLYTMPPEAWDFWVNYTNMSATDMGIIFPSGSLPSNVHGGLGYFFGYGMDQHIVHIK